MKLKLGIDQALGVAFISRSAGPSLCKPRQRTARHSASSPKTSDSSCSPALKTDTGARHDHHCHACSSVVTTARGRRLSYRVVTGTRAMRPCISKPLPFLGKSVHFLQDHDPYL